MTFQTSAPNDERPVAIVTAASRGIGAAIAHTLAHRGYRLALLARGDSVVELAHQLGGLAVQGSITEPESLHKLVETRHQRFGRIDAVVNNTDHAAVGSLLEIRDEGWIEALNLLVLSIVHMTRLVSPTTKGARRGGAIVNISSLAAQQPDPRFPLSSVLRGTLPAFSELFVPEYARYGMRMNTVLPGRIGQQSHENISAIPAGRAGEFREIAETVAFLLSTPAGYINGQTIIVDGGLQKGI